MMEKTGIEKIQQNAEIVKRHPPHSEEGAIACRFKSKQALALCAKSEACDRLQLIQKANASCAGYKTSEGAV